MLARPASSAEQQPPEGVVAGSKREAAERYRALRRRHPAAPAHAHQHGEAGREGADTLARTEGHRAARVARDGLRFRGVLWATTSSGGEASAAEEAGLYDAVAVGSPQSGGGGDDSSTAAAAGARRGRAARGSARRRQLPALPGHSPVRLTPRNAQFDAAGAAAAAPAAKARMLAELRQRQHLGMVALLETEQADEKARQVAALAAARFAGARAPWTVKLLADQEAQRQAARARIYGRHDANQVEMAARMGQLGALR